MNNQKLTEKEIVRATGAPFYTIRYLRDTGRLPIALPSKGRGYPTLYTSEAIEIVEEHLAARTRGVGTDINQQPRKN